MSAVIEPTVARYHPGQVPGGPGATASAARVYTESHRDWQTVPGLGDEAGTRRYDGELAVDVRTKNVILKGLCRPGVAAIDQDDKDAQACVAVMREAVRRLR